MADRKVLYPELKTRVFKGDKGLTASQAKKLLGWKEVTGKEPFHFAHNGKNVFCGNNVTNRPINRPNLLSLMQEILRGRWKLTSETIGIGKTGLVVDGQHTLVGLVMACDAYKASPATYPNFSAAPTLERIVVYGVEEDDDTINVINTGRPRSLADVIYRSGMFPGMDAKDCRKVSRVLEHAVRMLWDRTGIKDAYSLRRTHSESLEFLSNHGKLLECVQHIYAEDAGEGRIRSVMPLGYASALLYLMASSNTDGQSYYASEVRNEGHLVWGLLDKAQEFWVLLANKEESLRPVRNGIAQLTEGGTLSEKIAIIAKGWERFSQGKPVRSADVKLDYQSTPDGVTTLAEEPFFGGIDGGIADAPEPRGEDQGVAERTAEIRKKKQEKESEPAQPAKAEAKAKRSKKPAERNGKYTKGTKVWVEEPGKDVYAGRVVSLVPSGNGRLDVKVLNGHQGAGTIRSVDPSHFHDRQPQPTT